jgi:hypothetical protein
LLSYIYISYIYHIYIVHIFPQLHAINIINQERLSFGITLLLVVEVMRTSVATFVPICGELLWIDLFMLVNSVTWRTRCRGAGGDLKTYLKTTTKVRWELGDIPEKHVI